MASTKKTKPKKLTDAERHKRFVAMVQEVGASERPPGFDKAFRQVTKRKTPMMRKSS